MTNIDYLTENDRKRRLDSMLQTYNLTAIVNFPTRLQGVSSTTIDNIFIDNLKFSNYTVFPLFNGLSDHDAQLLIIKDIILQPQSHYVYTTRNINNSINGFKIDLSCCIVDGYCCYVVDRHCFFFLQDCGMYCMQVTSLFHHAESSPFCN